MDLLKDPLDPFAERNEYARGYYRKNRKKILARRSWQGKMQRRALRLVQTNHMFIEAGKELEPVRVAV